MTKVTGIIAAGVLAAMAFGQGGASNGTTGGAKEYFFLGAQKKDNLPPVKAVPVMAHKGSRVRPVNAAVHLGLRYNLLLVDRASNRSQTVDPDRIFKAGECFAIQLSSNRSGYLYVLAKQSSGNWLPLLPSPTMSEESNVIDPGQTRRIPGTYCFQVDNPPGDEVLFVALSRDASAVYQLHHDIEAPPPAEVAKQPEVTAPDPEAMEVADARSINNDVTRLADRFANRDIEIVKTGVTEAKAEEPAHTVYVASVSSQPTASLMTQIVVHHR